MHAVVGSLYVYLKNPVEFRFGGAFELPDVGDPRAIYEDMNRVLTGEPPEQISNRRLLGNVANMRRGLATGFHNLMSGAFRSLFINIQEPHPCTFLRKSLRDGLAYAAGSAGNNRRFAVKPLAIGLLPCVCQWKTPPFREIRSSTLSSSWPVAPPSARSLLAICPADAVREGPDLVDGHAHHIAILQPEWGILSHANAARRTGKDYRARKQRRALAEKFD
jgi:hypothetical protein